MKSKIEQLDRTPENWMFPVESLKEKIKKPFRRYFYPIYLILCDLLLKPKYGKYASFNVDQWVWGQKGNDYERLRSIVNNYCCIQGKKLLIVGCGTGKDILSWVKYKPEKLVGIDLFNYTKAWNITSEKCGDQTNISFIQADISKLDDILDGEIDIIGSDAVFEHVKNLPTVLREFHRVLKKGGILYATYGPLWYCWHGDHVSGYNGLEFGYNHLLLDSVQYKKYLDNVGDFAHSENDGRTWLKNDLFSYLRPCEYIKALEKAGFEKLYTRILVEPKAVQCLRKYKHLENELLQNHNLLDLIVMGMTIVYQKK